MGPAFGFDARYDRSVIIYNHAVSDNAIDRAIIDGLGATVVSYDEFEHKIKDARASKRPVRLTPSQKCLDGMRSAIYDLTAVCGVNDDDKWCVNDAIDAIDASSVMSLADGIRAINRAMDERDHGRVFDAMEAKGACLDDVDGSYAVIYQYGIKTSDLHMFAAARALGYIDPSVTRIAFINSSEFKVQTMRKVAKRASVILCGDGSERCVFDAMTQAGIKPENRSGYAIAISTDVTYADGRKLDTGADAGALRRVNALRAVRGRYYNNPYSGSYYSSARGGSLAKDIRDAVEAGVIDVPSSVKDAVESVIDGSYGDEKIAAWDNRLAKVFNRGFWNGYYLGQRLGEWSHTYGSEATRVKVYIGKGVKYYSNLGVAEFVVETQSLHVGDEIVITGPTTGAIITTVEEMRVDLKPVEEAVKGDHFSIKLDQKIRPSDKLYKWVAPETLKR